MAPQKAQMKWNCRQNGYSGIVLGTELRLLNPKLYQSAIPRAAPTKVKGSPTADQIANDANALKTGKSSSAWYDHSKKSMAKMVSTMNIGKAIPATVATGFQSACLPKTVMQQATTYPLMQPEVAKKVTNEYHKTGLTSTWLSKLKK